MTSSTKLDEKLEGADDFRAWKYRIMLVLKEHDLVRFVEGEVIEPEDEVAKTRVQKGHGERKGGDEACVGILRPPADSPWSKELTGMCKIHF